MDEAGRAAFLERFVEGGQGVGLAVLGSAFAEGVDLPGTRLIGAFVATLGLPQVNPVNEAMQRAPWMPPWVPGGAMTTPTFPGLRKVVQAAGHVIRTEQDRGVVVLVDDRFQRRGQGLAAVMVAGGVSHRSSSPGQEVLGIQPTRLRHCKRYLLARLFLARPTWLIFRRIRHHCALGFRVLGNVWFGVWREWRMGRIIAILLLLGVWLANGIHFFVLGK
jgi:hypothetical protein